MIDDHLEMEYEDRNGGLVSTAGEYDEDDMMDWGAISQDRYDQRYPVSDGPY